MKYLIGIDIDGTLRNDRGEISKYSKEIIKQVRKQGHYIVLCTARPFYHAKDVSKEIGGCQYLICLSGSQICDLKNHLMIYEAYLDNDAAKTLYNYAVNNNIRIMFSIGRSEYVTQFTRNENQILLCESNEDVLNGKVRECMVIDSNKDKVIEFRKEMEKRGINSIVHSCDQEERKEHYFVIVSNESSKGSAIKKLRTILNIEKEQVISFGNDENDISMFLESGKGFAVSNSKKELIDVAEEVIESNNKDGVAKRSKLFLKGENKF